MPSTAQLVKSQQAQLLLIVAGTSLIGLKRIATHFYWKINCL